MIMCDNMTTITTNNTTYFDDFLYFSCFRVKQHDKKKQYVPVKIKLVGMSLKNGLYICMRICWSIFNCWIIMFHVYLYENM